MNKVYWYTVKDPYNGSKLVKDITVDVVVVGGGIAGLSCAQKLIGSGMSVALIEKDFCGSGASGKSSGFITPDSEIELSSLVSKYGPLKAKKIWEFAISGVDLIRNNIHKYNISCDYENQDSLFISNTALKVKYPKEEYEARKSLGYESSFYESEVESIVGSKKYSGGVKYPDTFGINSYLYCQELRNIDEKLGVHVYENTEVVKILENGVQTKNGFVSAKHVVVCADRFIPDFGVLEKEIYHVQTFLGISNPLSEEDVKKIFPKEKVMVWDTDLVYNYFRITGDNRLLLGGGDVLYTYAHNTTNNTKRFKRRLSKYFKNKFPNINFELEYVWPGMLGVSKDLLPIVGFDDKMKNVWYVGAATGLPWASALGVYSAEKIINGRSEFDLDFSWKRKFMINSKVQTLLTTPMTYAISHGITKYFK